MIERIELLTALGVDRHLTDLPDAILRRYAGYCGTRRRNGEQPANTNFNLDRRASPRPYLAEPSGEIPLGYSTWPTNLSGRLDKAGGVASMVVCTYSHTDNSQPMPTIKTKLLIGAWATREYQNAIGASQR